MENGIEYLILGDMLLDAVVRAIEEDKEYAEIKNRVEGLVAQIG